MATIKTPENRQRMIRLTCCDKVSRGYQPLRLVKESCKGTVPQNYHEILNEVSRDWQNVFVLTGVNDHYIGVLSHTLYCYWAEEYRSLYRGFRYIGVRYIGILSHTLLLFILG